MPFIGYFIIDLFGILQDKLGISPVMPTIYHVLQDVLGIPWIFNIPIFIFSAAGIMTFFISLYVHFFEIDKQEDNKEAQ